MKRRVAKLVEPKRFEFFEEDMPVPGPDEILVRTLFVGLCHSDLPVYFGTGCTTLNHNGYHIMDADIPFPVTLGHEPAGIVEAVGANITRFKPGDAVSGMVHGSFATHFIATDEMLVPVAIKPGTYPMAEPLVCIANIAQIAAPEFGDRVAVIGCGFMGLMVTMALANRNLRQLTAVDVLEDRLGLAERYGAESRINPAREDLEDAAFKLTGGRMYDVVVEITGSLRGLDSALRVVRLADRFGHRGRGKVLIPSLYGREETWSPRIGYNMMLRGPVLHAAHPRYCIDLQDSMQRGVDMYDAGVLRMDELISHKFAFDDLPRAFEVLAGGDPSYIKGIVTF